MKRLLLIIAIVFISCSEDVTPQKWDWGDEVVSLTACDGSYTLIGRRPNGDVYSASVSCGFFYAYKEGDYINAVTVIRVCG